MKVEYTITAIREVGPIDWDLTKKTAQCCSSKTSSGSRK